MSKTDEIGENDDRGSAILELVIALQCFGIVITIIGVILLRAGLI